jgi:hypothetical protein
VSQQIYQECMPGKKKVQYPYHDKRSSRFFCIYHVFNYWQTWMTRSVLNTWSCFKILSCLWIRVLVDFHHGCTYGLWNCSHRGSFSLPYSIFIYQMQNFQYWIVWINHQVYDVKFASP